MAGQECGYLTVLSLAASHPGGKVKWLCRCVCGNEVSVTGTHLRNGHTKSCGCMHRPAIERFLEKTRSADDGCIEWIGGTNGVGYGTFHAGKKLRTYAHRWSYQYHVGPIPDGMHLDHLCRNPKCVNPEHLEPVTCRENLLRGVGPSALHAAKTHCPAGHPYVGDNLYVHPRKGYRVCRACGRERARQIRSRKGA